MHMKLFNRFFSAFMTVAMAFFIVCAIVLPFSYSASKKIWANGISVVGTAEKINSRLSKNMVEIVYEADGKEEKRKACFTKKDFEKLMNDDDAEQKCEIEIRYMADKPEKGISQQDINCTRYTMVSCFIAAPLCILIVFLDRLKSKH